VGRDPAKTFSRTDENAGADVAKDQRLAGPLRHDREDRGGNDGDRNLEEDVVVHANAGKVAGRGPNDSARAL
jgi:hypothetical protein